MSVNFKSRFVSSLGEIVTLVTEEKKKLDGTEAEAEAAGGGGGGGEQNNEGEGDDEADAAFAGGVRASKGTASGRYFRKCSNVLRAQVEVRPFSLMFSVTSEINGSLKCMVEVLLVPLLSVASCCCCR